MWEKYKESKQRAQETISLAKENKQRENASVEAAQINQIVWIGLHVVWILVTVLVWS